MSFRTARTIGLLGNRHIITSSASNIANAGVRLLDTPHLLVLQLITTNLQRTRLVQTAFGPEITMSVELERNRSGPLERC